LITLYRFETPIPETGPEGTVIPKNCLLPILTDLALVRYFSQNLPGFS